MSSCPTPSLKQQTGTPYSYTLFVGLKQAPNLLGKIILVSNARETETQIKRVSDRKGF
jgi:hypothetical protein